MGLSEGLNLFKKKFPDRYLDGITGQEFPYSEINNYPSWYRNEYDQAGNRIYFEDSNGYWEKRAYNDAGKLRYIEDSKGYREKC